jgi:hypothetical protein
MRNWFNSILVFIGESSLTDAEYDSINFVHLVVLTYDQYAYDELAAILTARGSIGTSQERLIGLFKAKGTDVDSSSVAQSNIYLGSVLE